LLEDRWVPASPPTATGGTGLTAAQQAQLAAAAQQAGLTTQTQATTETTAAATTTATGPTFLPDRGAKPAVTLVTSSGTAGSSVTVYDTAYTGGVWTTRADLTGDGTPDVVSAPGVGLAPTVKVVSGADGTVVRSFNAYEPDFTGGVVVAAVDLNADGRADLITGTDQGGGPRVKVFDGLTGSQLADFFAIDDAEFRGGVRVAGGDVNGDGVPDLVAAAGYGGGPRVAIWDGKALLRGVQQRVVADFFAFEPGLRNGVYPAVGAFNSDKYADLLFGAGPGGGPRVLAVSGERLVNSSPAAAVVAPLFDFFAGLADDRGGVRVGTVPGTTSSSTTSVVNDVLTVGGSGGIGTLYSGSTRKGVQSVDRELALAGGLLADASGQKLFSGTSGGSSSGGTTTGGLGSGVNVGTALQQLLNQLAGQTTG
jgi:hypothetical protein